MSSEIVSENDIILLNMAGGVGLDVFQWVC